VCHIPSSYVLVVEVELPVISGTRGVVVLVVGDWLGDPVRPSAVGNDSDAVFVLAGDAGAEELGVEDAEMGDDEAELVGAYVAVAVGRDGDGVSTTMTMVVVLVAGSAAWMGTTETETMVVGEGDSRTTVSVTRCVTVVAGEGVGVCTTVFSTVTVVSGTRPCDPQLLQLVGASLSGGGLLP
jgi:hypothetical protein